MSLLLRRGALGRVFLAFCFAVLSQPAFAQSGGATWLLAIGAAEESEPAAADARDVFDFLSGALGVPASHARFLVGQAADLHGIAAALGRLSAASPGDAVVIYFAGEAVTHDLPNGGQLGALLPVGASPAPTALAEQLTMRRLERALGGVPADRVLLLVDAALGGTGTRLPDHADSTGLTRHVLVAAGSGESVERGGEGALAVQLRRALAEGAADADRDGRVSASELGAYVEGAVFSVTEGRQRPYFRAFEMGPGEVTLPLSPGAVPAGALPPPTPAPPSGALRVETDVAGSEVRLDGEFVGRTPLHEAPVPSGEGWVEIEGEGLAPWGQGVHVRPGETLTLRPALTASAGFAVLGGLPSGAEVRVDGEPMMEGAVGPVLLPVGRREVEVRVPGQRSARGTVRVRPGETVIIEYHARGHRPGYLFRSVAFPGWGQWADGRPFEAAAFAVGLAGAFVFEREAYATFGRAGDEYVATRAAYLAATSEEEAVRLRGAMEEEYDAVARARRNHGVLVAVAVGAYVANLVDSYFHHTRGPALVFSRPDLALAPVVLPEGGAGLGFTLRLR